MLAIRKIWFSRTCGNSWKEIYSADRLTRKNMIFRHIGRSLHWVESWAKLYFVMWLLTRKSIDQHCWGSSYSNPLSLVNNPHRIYSTQIRSGFILYSLRGKCNIYATFTPRGKLKLWTKTDNMPASIQLCLVCAYFMEFHKQKPLFAFERNSTNTFTWNIGNCKKSAESTPNTSKIVTKRFVAWKHFQIL